MFYDLNVPYSANDAGLPRTLHFLHELGYNVVALNHSMSGKLPNEFSCAIPSSPAKDLPPTIRILRRVTLTLTDSLQNARLTQLASHYDLLALRPMDEKSLQLACSSLDCDIVSLDLSIRFPTFFKHKMLMEAIKAGKKIEICYAQGLLGDAQQRRQLISNATQLIRATRGRGLVISSEAKGAVGLRGPWDVVNLAAVWGLGQERGHEAVSKEARSAVVTAQLKRTSFRGVINVVYGGDKPAASERKAREKGMQGKNKQVELVNGQKRKSDAVEGDAVVGSDNTDKPMSKTQMKKRAKKEKMEAEATLKNGSGDAKAG